MPLRGVSEFHLWLEREEPSKSARNKVDAFLEANPQVHLHFTPTHASWLNQVELFFSILERRLLRRGEVRFSVEDLAQRIIGFINDGVDPVRRTG